MSFVDKDRADKMERVLIPTPAGDYDLKGSSGVGGCNWNPEDITSIKNSVDNISSIVTANTEELNVLGIPNPDTADETTIMNFLKKISESSFVDNSSKVMEISDTVQHEYLYSDVSRVEVENNADSSRGIAFIFPTFSFKHSGNVKIKVDGSVRFVNSGSSPHSPCSVRFHQFVHDVEEYNHVKEFEPPGSNPSKYRYNARPFETWLINVNAPGSSPYYGFEEPYNLVNLIHTQSINAGSSWKTYEINTNLMVKAGQIYYFAIYAILPIKNQPGTFSRFEINETVPFKLSFCYDLINCI